MPLVQSLSKTSRRVRVCYFNTWATALEDARAYVARVRGIELGPLVTDPKDTALLVKARLDCDWYGENTRCFAALEHPELEFLPAWVCGIEGILSLVQAPYEPEEERWLITIAHTPQALGPAVPRVFAFLKQQRVRHLLYAFDEASRFLTCFNAIAPHLDVLIHDESPLTQSGQAQLSPRCRTLHRSWVANVVPFAVPFNEAPLKKILFLGSQLGLTPHRQRQIDFLRTKFKDRFVGSYDHSIAVAERDGLNRYKVGLCPEGRKFTTPAMAETHTDRPFWSGCLGLVPVSENSKAGGRLEELHRQGLILRYPHGDLDALAAQCERALEMTNDERRKIYDHFNRHETVGVVVADAIAAS